MSVVDSHVEQSAVLPAPCLFARKTFSLADVQARPKYINGIYIALRPSPDILTTVNNFLIPHSFLLHLVNQ